MMPVVMIVYGNEHREAAAHADNGHDKDDGGKNFFHGVSEGTATLE